MNFNWPIIGDKIFGILKGSGFKLQMFDKSGAKTLDPHEATRFFATTASKEDPNNEYSILISLHDENADSHVEIKTPEIKNTADFNFIRKIKNSLQRNVGEREGLSVNWLKFNHVIRPKDDAYNNIVESKDISKPFGSTKSSYQKVGDSKLIIRHNDVVDEGKVGSRWRHVKAIFIENRVGERFLYPHMHITGARAMARHLSNDGAMHDEIGEAIQKLSGDYTDLKKSARMLRGTGDDSKTIVLSSAMQGINKQAKRLCGPRGYQTVSAALMEKTDENESKIAEIHADLMERCGCKSDDEDSKKVLLTAARYLATSKDQRSQIGFKKTPDLTSKLSQYPDQKERLAWQIAELAECVDDDSIRDQLMGVSTSIRDQGAFEPSSLDLIKMVFKASRGINHRPVAETSLPSDLDRIKKLSGL